MVNQRRHFQLLEEQPYAHAIETDAALTHCAACLKSFSINKVNGKACSGCQSLYYCGEQCQTIDLPFHKHECPLLVINKPGLVDSSVRLFVRILVRQSWDRDDEHTQTSDRTFDDLMTHEQEFRESDILMTKFNNRLQQVREFLTPGSNITATDDEIFLIWCRLQINGISITDSSKPEQFRIGVGVYIELSRLDHSCRPTARIQFSGSKASLIDIGNTCIRQTTCAAIDVPQYTITYTDLLQNRAHRRQQLEQYHFVCTCQRCSDYQESLDSSFRCQHCQSGFVPWLETDVSRGSTPGTCTSCGEQMNLVQWLVCEQIQDLAVTEYDIWMIDLKETQDLSQLFKHKQSTVNKCLAYLSDRNINACKLVLAMMYTAIKAKQPDSVIDYWCQLAIKFRSFFINS